MGLKDILTKPLFQGKHAFRWQEPRLFRFRLMGDLVQRIVLVLAAWLLGTGVLLMMFSVNRQPPGIGLGFGLGIAFGLGPAALVLFFGKRHVPGRVTVSGVGIERRRAYSPRVPLWMVNEYGELPYECIDHCSIVPGQRIDMPFSVMLLEVEDDEEIYGIPHSVDLKELAKYLRSLGVSVSSGDDIPDTYWQGLPMVSAIIGSVVGISGFVVGLLLYLRAT